MNWHDYHLNLLDPISVKSKDPNTKLGCLIVGLDNEIRSTGFNSFPRRVRDLQDEVPERFERPEKYQWIEHAERNAIYNAARCGVALKNCRLYIGIMPCMDCARGIIQAGITEVIFDDGRQRAYPGGATWIESWKKVIQMFEEAHVYMAGYRPYTKEGLLIHPSRYIPDEGGFIASIYERVAEGNATPIT